MRRFTMGHGARTARIGRVTRKGQTVYRGRAARTGPVRRAVACAGELGGVVGGWRWA